MVQKWRCIQVSLSYTTDASVERTGILFADLLPEIWEGAEHIDVGCCFTTIYSWFPSFLISASYLLCLLSFLVCF